MKRTYEKVVPSRVLYDSRLMGKTSKGSHDRVSDSRIDPNVSHSKIASLPSKRRPADCASRDIHRNDGCPWSILGFLWVPPPLIVQEAHKLYWQEREFRKTYMSECIPENQTSFVCGVRVAATPCSSLASPPQAYSGRNLTQCSSSARA